MFRFRFSHFAVCVAFTVCGVTVGRGIFSAYGPTDVCSLAEGRFFFGFLDGFYSVLLPMVILGTLSVTVYCTPVALAFLCFRSTADGYCVISAIEQMHGADMDRILLCIFVSAVHAFYTYGYFLLAMRCMLYRAKVRLLPCTAHTILRPGSRSFFCDYTSVAGVLTLCGLFSYTVMYFL